MPVEVDIDSRRPTRISVLSEYRYKDLIKSIPGASWAKEDSYWTVPLSWSSCLALRETFRADLVIGPLLTAWAYSERASRIDPAMALRDALDAEGDPDLYSFQRAGVEFLSIVERGILADEMGSGKTIQAIRALKKMQDDGKDVFPVLVVCPNSMKRTWAREIEKWWPGTTTSVVDGSAVKRRKAIDAKADWTIVNWEGLRAHSRLASFGGHALNRCAECGGTGTVTEGRCQVHPRELNAIDFRSVIADEAHRAKNPRSQQTLALRAASGDAEFRFALTGSPIANDPTELWSILHWVDQQEWPSKTRWVDRLVDFTFNVWGGMEINGIKPTAEDEFRGTIDPRMRRMLKSIVLPFLPPIVHERRDVDMHPKQAKAYQQMAEDLVAKLDSGVLLSANPMVQVGRLMQFASSYGDLTTDLDGAEHLVLMEPSSKIDAFMNDLDDFGGQSVVVFAESRQLINLLSDRMRLAGVRHGLITGDQTTEQRTRAIDDFQKGDFQFILCTIKAGGVGITLTRASVAVFLQRSWSSVDMDQAQARIHRIGSEVHDSVLIVDYVTPGTVEEAQIWALKRKRGMLEEIVRDKDLLRRVLKGEATPGDFSD